MYSGCLIGHKTGYSLTCEKFCHHLVCSGFYFLVIQSLQVICFCDFFHFFQVIQFFWHVIIQGGLLGFFVFPCIMCKVSFSFLILSSFSLFFSGLNFCQFSLYFKNQLLVSFILSFYFAAGFYFIHLCSDLYFLFSGNIRLNFSFSSSLQYKVWLEVEDLCTENCKTLLKLQKTQMEIQLVFMDWKKC